MKITIVALLLLCCCQCSEIGCYDAMKMADKMVAEGKARDAIILFDEVDSRCGCMHDTGGDEPEEHAAMRYYLRELQKREGSQAVTDVLQKVKGPMASGFKNSQNPDGKYSL